MRLKYIDIAKGILIILVVLGHSYFKYARAIYWFHMPVFFMLSGLVFKQYSTDRKGFKKAVQQISKLLWTYLIYFVLITIAIYIFRDIQFNNDALTTELKNLILGGQLLKGERTVFWFINNLILIYLLMYGTAWASRITKIDNRLILIVVSALFFTWGHDVRTLPNFGEIYNDKLWNYPALSMSFPYFVFGYLIKDITNKLHASFKLQKRFFAMNLLLLGIFLFYQITDRIDFRLSLKSGLQENIFLDALIPVVFYFLVVIISVWIEKSRFKAFGDMLEKMGLLSLIIMYLHPPIIHFFIWLIKDSWYIYTFFGVLVPFAFGVMCMKNRQLSAIFLGKFRK